VCNSDVDSTCTWNEYDGSSIGPFQESCNVIYYKSYDPLNNMEQKKKFAFFVDKTAPEMTKTIGTPKAPLFLGYDFDDRLTQFTSDE
jgi:hypothetical protein